MSTEKTEKMEEFQFDLDTPFNYAYKGDEQAAEFITLKAPTSRNRSTQAKLKQAFFRALPKDESSRDEIKEESSQDSSDELTGAQIMTLIAMSKDVELGEVIIIATEIFTSGVALVEGEEKLTRTLLDLMGYDDLERMTGEYMANFIVASLFKSQKRG